jgi:hypothetical protein
MNFIFDFFRLLADDRVKVALVTFALALLALLGVPQERQDQVVKLIYAACGLAAAIIVGMSYEKGKNVEGTVPDGSRSVYDNARPSQIPTKTDPVTGRQTLLGLVALFVICASVFMSGCNASPAFVRGVKQVGPHIADEAQHYVESDAAISSADKADRTARIMRFQAASTNVINNADVASAWAGIRLFYQAYVDSDVTLDPDEKSVREQRISGFDKMIQSDAARPLSLIPATQP